MRIESVRTETSGMTTFVAAGGFSFSAPKLQFETAGLSPESFSCGRECSDEEERLIREVSSAWEARKKAFELCARAEQSEAGLRNKLLSRGFSRSAVTAAIDEMRSQGFVDDVRYAKAWVASRTMRRSTGPSLIAAELRARGIREEAVKAALADFPARENLQKAIKIEAAKLDALEHRGDAGHIGDGANDRDGSGPRPKMSGRVRRDALKRKLRSLGYRGDTIDELLDDQDV